MCGACLVLGRRDCLTKAARAAAAQAQVDRLPDRTTRMQPTEDSYTTVLVPCIALVCRDSRGAPVRPARRAFCEQTARCAREINAHNVRGEATQGSYHCTHQPSGAGDGRGVAG